jgi:putative protease
MPEFLEKLDEFNADGVILSDIGVLAAAKKYAPNVPVHISTQAGVVNYAAAEMFYNLGAVRVVLARELSIDEIAQIRAKTNPNLEIECFVHGAMCVSFSGRCVISNYLAGRDANRGDCAQPCRWKYRLTEENRPGHFFDITEQDGGTYLYNSKDMCMIDHLPELIKAGVTSLKIEGRAKTAYYTAATAKAYRAAINAALQGQSRPQWATDVLEKISHRDYSTGFYLGEPPGQNVGSGGYIRNYDFVAVCEDSFENSATIVQRNKFFCGDVLDVLPPVGEPFEVTAQKLQNADGQEVESTPHPLERLTLITDRQIPPGSFLRKKRSIIK